MDLATILGIVAGTSVVGLAIIFGGSAGMFLNIPSVLIVFGGTIAGVLIRFPLADVMNALKLGTSNAFQQHTQSAVGLIDQAVELAELSRTKGQLALENAPIDNEFLRKGALMYCDGLQPEFITHALSRDRDLLIERLEEGEKIYRFMGDAAPAFGMIGTLVGLVQMLSTMDNPETIGPSMAVALLTTLYGALIANLIALPIADKLANKAKIEYTNRSLVVEAVNQIAEKQNPDSMYQLLSAFLPEDQRRADER
jgi:chemotaxis protein MotA